MHPGAPPLLLNPTPEQYENAYCGDTSGDHHHNGGAGGFDAQLKATLTFNAALKAQGLYQTGADAYASSGGEANHPPLILSKQSVADPLSPPSPSELLESR